MDLNRILHLVFIEKLSLTMGIIIALLLLALVLLLLRAVLEEKEAAVTGGPALDQKSLNHAIEGALKKALGDKPIGEISAGAEKSGESDAEAGGFKKILSEREAKIAALVSDLEAVKAELESRPATAPGGQAAGGGADPELQKKFAELQAKLSEYEIIEDDIADLSIYKEENRKLKEELEQLKMAGALSPAAAASTAPEPSPVVDAAAASAAVSPPAPEAAGLAQMTQPETLPETLPETAAAPEPPREPAVPTVAPVALEASPDSATKTEINPAADGAPGASDRDASLAEFSEAVASSQGEPSTAAPVQATTSEPFKLDTADDVMGEFARVLSGASPASRPAPNLAEAGSENPADPFGPLDTEKMLEEVSKLGESSTADSPSVLEEPLDTERLMAEMGMSEAAAKPSVADEFANAVAGSPAPERPSMPVTASGLTQAPPQLNETPVDDLLAEFQDDSFDAAKASKGS